MIWPFENNTNTIEKKLARQSLKSSPIRDILTGLTIMLSVALLSGFILSVIGMQTATHKGLQVSNHVLYRDVDKAQIEQLRCDERISDTLLIKQAPNTQIENYLVIPLYIEQKNSQIATEKVVEGHYPEQLYEAAVDKAYLRRLGLPEELGTTLTISFYDGNTETFTIVGLMDSGSTERVYSLYCSKEYAEHGSQLENAISALAVQLTDAEKMSTRTFEEMAWKIGTDYGITRRNSDVNNWFASSLSPNKDDILITIIVALAVAFVSYLVIYSIFYIYVQNQVREFGQLRTIGATSKQIRRIIHSQGKILCILGTAAGLPIGSLVAYLFKPNGWHWFYTIAASIFVFLFSYFLVLISIQKSARLAGSISPIEAMNSTGYPITSTTASKKLRRKITPFSLAVIGTSRNKKKLILTILSLGVAGIMFMAGTTMLSSLDMERFARHGLMKYGEFVIQLSGNAQKNDTHGQTGIQQNNPLSNDFIQTISQIEGVNQITTIQRLEIQYTYNDVQERNSFSPFTKEDQLLLEQYLADGYIDYDEMCSNNEILLMRNDYSEIVHGWRFQVGDTVKIRWYDGKEYQNTEYKIIGEIHDEIFQTVEGSKVFAKTQFFLLPDVALQQMMTSGFNLNSHLIISIHKAADEPAIRNQLSTLVANTPLIIMDTLYDYYKDSKAMYQRTSAVIWGINGFVMLFAVINLINTLIASILSRKYEFSILRSIGMDTKQLQRTIQYEGFILAFWNIMITLFCGGAIGFYIIFYLNSIGNDTWIWTFPVWYFIGYIIVAILLPAVISNILIQLLNKKTLIEQLRDLS